MALLGLVLACALAVAGVPVAPALRMSAVITVQGLGGVLLAAWALPRRVATFGILGVGLALGTGLSAVSSLIFGHVLPALPIETEWLLPTVLMCIIALVRNPLIRSIHVPRANALAAIGVLALGLFMAAPFWVSNTLQFPSWTKLYGDLYYHEALSNSFPVAGVANLTVLDGGLRYHWLADAWSGFLTSVGDLPPFAATSRGVTVYALTASIMVAWEIGRLTGRSRRASILAALVTVAAAGIGLPIAATYGFVSAEWSPTHTFAVPLLLSVLVIVLAGSRGARRLSILFLVGTISALLITARSPQAAVMLVAVASVVLVVRREGQAARRAAELLGAAIAGVIFGYVLAVSGGPANGLSVGINDEVPSVLGLVPVGAHWGWWLAVPALVAAYGAILAGLGPAWLLKRMVSRAAVGWSTGAAASGLVLSLVVIQSGGSEITFIWAGVVAGAGVSGAGVASSWDRLTGAGRGSAGFVLLGFGVLAGVALMLLHEAATSWPLGGYVRWGAPLVLCAAAIFVAWIASRRWASVDRRRLAASIAAVILVAASAAAAVAASFVLLLRGQPIATAVDGLAITDDYVQAGEWVRANTDRTAVFATDRQCGNPAESPPQCGSTWSGPAALGARQALIETVSYSLGDGPWPPARVDDMLASWRMGTTPNVDDACYLWKRGVRWFWSDRRVPGSTANGLARYGRTMFANDAVAITQLAEPRCGQS